MYIPWLKPGFKKKDLGEVSEKAEFSPTDPFTTLELQNPSHDVPEIRRSPDVEVQKLRKGRSGGESQSACQACL